MAGNPLCEESVWFQQQRYQEAEAHYQAVLAGSATPESAGTSTSSLVNQISQTRQNIQSVLKRNSPGGAGDSMDGGSLKRIEALERENKALKKTQQEMKHQMETMMQRIAQLELGGGAAPAAASKTAAAASKPAVNAAGGDDDDFDLFGSDDEEDSAEAEKLKQERIDMYKKKKAGKTVVIAKSSVVIDVKPWEDTTDMGELEKAVRSIKMDGLLWGASKLVPVGYGIRKLQIMMTIEDDKVSVDDLCEQITTDSEEYVQSVDVVAFNKI